MENKHPGSGMKRRETLESSASATGRSRANHRWAVAAVVAVAGLVLGGSAAQSNAFEEMIAMLNGMIAAKGSVPEGIADGIPEHQAAQETATTGRSGSNRWGANYFPNVPLVTHEGETVHLFDDLIEGKVVVINFIYTTCGDVCPLDTARLKTVQQILGDRVGRDVFMYSITIDPDRDTPEALAEYAKRYRVGPGWTFLTGKESDILLLRKKLGLYMEGLEDKFDHNMSFVIGNQRTGRWMKRSPMDNPHFIAEQIGGWLTNWKAPSEIINNNYAHAPELKPPSMGENLFRTRCTICHTIGAGNAQHTIGGDTTIQIDRHRAGPDLMHVTEKRDRAWLARWLANPEKMLAEKDPIALAIYSEYDGVIMPNLKLNEIEVNALIEYMAAESQRVQQASPVSTATGAAPSGHDHHQHHH